MPITKLKSILREPQTKVLAIHCSDYRFIDGYHEFLSDTLGLDGNYDLIAVPGGPQSLTALEYLPKFSWASMKWFRFLIEAHSVKRLILFQHHDCAWYRTIPLHLHSSPEPRLRQEEDLGRVAAILRKNFPQLSIEGYYVGLDSDKHVTVERVDG
jgi:hypothetical protein